MSLAIEPAFEETLPAESTPDASPDPSPTVGAATTPGVRRSKAGRLWNNAMRWIRRIHLYSGILMFPFVLLYGFTGWFFNHPAYFTGDEVATFTAADVVDGKLGQLTSAEEMARQVVEEINFERFLAGAPEVEFTDRRPPQFSSYFTFTVSADAASHRISVDPLTGAGEIRTTHSGGPSATGDASASARPLSELRRVEIERNALAEARGLIPDALTELGLPGGEVSAGRRAPNLTFSANIDGRATVVTYNLSNGSLSAVDSSAPGSTGLKPFLQRLHLSRTYGPHVNIRWFWALLVDFMFATMVFWGFSGLLMWWQIKRTRVLGAAMLVAGLGCAMWLGLGMHDELATGGQGVRGGSHSQTQRRGPEAHLHRGAASVEHSPKRTSGAIRGGVGKEPAAGKEGQKGKSGMLNPTMGKPMDGT